MTPAIAVREAYRVFGSGNRAAVALQGLTMTVDPGEIVVLLGPSGSGKTTLLRALSGFERLSAGRLRVLGTDLSGLGARATASFRARNLGFLDQHYLRALSPDLSCRETVGLQLGLLGRDRAQSGRIVAELLERVGLRDRADARPRELSGGEQQRIAVCAAVAHRPRLLLVDEPAGELDAENAAIVYRLLREVAQDVGATMLVVSHDPAAASIADRRVHIRDGRVVAEGAPGDELLLVPSRGWVRLPHDLVERVGRPRRLRVRGRRAEIALSSADPPAVDELPDTESCAAEPSPLPTVPKGLVVAELRAVTKAYRSDRDERVVLAGLECAFEEGLLTAVYGRSGTGKTTLLHVLAGLELPTAGEVFVAGRRIDEATRSERAEIRRQHIALVTQEPGLVPYLSALENVELTLQLRKSQRPGSSAREALVEVGLEDRTHERASRLSAGERQRVVIARALACTARLLLVDEPTARLDDENARLVGELFARAAHHRGLAVVCATHDEVLIEMADTTLELDGS